MKAAIEKYKKFHGTDDFTIQKGSINLPDTWIYIGKNDAISYLSNKWDGKTRGYIHKLKKFGDILVSPKGDCVMIINLKLNVKSIGLTG